jgi:hypothetical protein
MKKERFDRPRSLQEHLGILKSRAEAVRSGQDAAASRHIFEQAYDRARQDRPGFLRRLGRFGVLPRAAAALLAVAAGLGAFHLSETRHVWSDFSRVGAGETIQASSERRVTVFHGLSPAKIIRLERGASLRRDPEQNRWELAAGEATIHVRKLKPGSSFHLRSGHVHLVSTGPVEYTVKAMGEAANPNTVTVSVQGGTVNCCADEAEFPIASGEKVTLTRDAGARTQILAFESD